MVQNLIQLCKIWLLCLHFFFLKLIHFGVSRELKNFIWSTYKEILIKLSIYFRFIFNKILNFLIWSTDDDIHMIISFHFATHISFLWPIIDFKLKLLILQHNSNLRSKKIYDVLFVDVIGINFDCLDCFFPSVLPAALLGGPAHGPQEASTSAETP